MSLREFTGGGPELERAKNRAREIIRKYGIRSASEISLELVAWDAFKAVVEEKEITSCAARVVRGQRHNIISVDRNSPVGRKRFSIAHELGHISLHPAINQMTLCSQTDLFNYRRVHPAEREANTFATELLMPEEIFSNECGDWGPTLASVNELAELFKVSRLSAALRLIELTSEPCALVFSKGDKIEWSYSSRSFRFELRSNSLDKDSFAIDLDCGQYGSSIPSKKNFASRWLSRPSKSCEWLWEESMCLGRFGRMTLLWDYDRER